MLRKHFGPGAHASLIPTRSVLVSAAELSGILLCVGFWIAIGQRVAVGPAPGLIPFLLTVLLGVAAADAGSGMAHWFCDTFFEETSPIIGPHLIASFREHHRDPLALTRHGYIERNGTNCLTLFPIHATVWWLGPAEPESISGSLAYMFVLTFSMALTATNEFHSWAHDPMPPRIGRWLQRCGIAISPSHHARHHTPPHRTNYCVTNGWVNPLANWSGFFTLAEWLLVHLGIPRKGPGGGGLNIFATKPGEREY